MAKSLVGKNEADIVALLGTPAEVRNQPPAMIWRYASNQCRLDLAFYFDVGNQDFRALSYKFHPDLRAVASEAECLSSIRETDQSKQKQKAYQ